MPPGSGDEVLDGLWRFETPHPDWTPDEGGEEGWEQIVAWWALRSPAGLVIVDPLLADDWEPLDRLVEAAGGCAGIVRTIHWHQRSVADASARYGADVWAQPPPPGTPELAFGHAVADGATILAGLRAFATGRRDELALWLPRQSALLFGDAMLRRDTGELRRCPDSWMRGHGGPEALSAFLRKLAERLPVEHVLVDHGPLVLGDGASALAAAAA